jgi:hypothetical protein
MAETRTVSCDTFLKLYDLYEGDCSKFLKFDAKFNSNKKGNAHYNNAFVKVDDIWIPFYLRINEEQMAFWIPALTDEDASKQTTELGVKKPITSRTSSITQKASMQFMLYSARLDIDPKTGELADPNTLPPDSAKSKLVRVIMIIEAYRDDVYAERIKDKRIVDNVRDIVQGVSFKVSSLKICPMVRRYYGDKSPLAGKLMINPSVSITLQFQDSGAAPKDTYYRNDITPQQKLANKNLKGNKKHYNPVPYTFTDEDGTVVPINASNVHRIPVNSEATFGVAKISVCSSSQGISIPMAFYKLVVTTGERSKISIASAYSDDEDEEETPAATTSDTTANTKAVTPDADDEPNLDGLEDE